MAWKSIYESEQVSIVADTGQARVLMEVSSGGVRPRFVTLQLEVSELDLLIEALQSAKASISG